jgi:hypothetical protein
VDLDLGTLKREILEYLDASGFAVFRSQPGGLEGLPKVLWDCERFPDYQMFLDAARKVGVTLILFASRDFEIDEIEDALGQLEECEIPREERRDYERRLRETRVHEGAACSLELAFDHHSRMYVYELHPDWYEEFLATCDEIVAQLPDTGKDDDSSSSGFYPDYSNN